jgi:hypothetical protein
MSNALKLKLLAGLLTTLPAGMAALAVYILFFMQILPIFRVIIALLSVVGCFMSALHLLRLWRIALSIPNKHR